MANAETHPVREGALSEVREVDQGETVDFPERKLSYGSWLGTVPARSLHVRGHPTLPAITAPVRSPVGITRLLHVRVDARGVAYDVPAACVRPPATPRDPTPAAVELLANPIDLVAVIGESPHSRCMGTSEEQGGSSAVAANRRPKHLRVWPAQGDQDDSDRC